MSGMAAVRMEGGGGEGTHKRNAVVKGDPVRSLGVINDLPLSNLVEHEVEHIGEVLVSVRRRGIVQSIELVIVNTREVERRRGSKTDGPLLCVA
jgi:hypothetical protein